MIKLLLYKRTRKSNTRSLFRAQVKIGDNPWRLYYPGCFICFYISIFIHQHIGRTCICKNTQAEKQNTE